MEYTLLLGFLALTMFTGIILLGEQIGVRFIEIDSAEVKVAQADASRPDLTSLDIPGTDQPDSGAIKTIKAIRTKRAIRITRTIIPRENLTNHQSRGNRISR